MSADKKKPSSDNGLHSTYEKAMGALYKKDFDKALELFEKIEKEFPGEEEILARVRVLKRVCDNQAPTADGKSSESLFDLGVYHHNCGEYEEAIKLYQQALKKAKGVTWHIQYAIASTKARQGNTKDAVVFLKKATQENEEAKFFAEHDPDFRSLADQSGFKKLIDA